MKTCDHIPLCTLIQKIFILITLGIVPMISGTLPPAAGGQPVDGQFVQVGDLTGTRWSPGALRLADGRIFLAGGIWIAGYGLRDAELFDPITGAWTETGEMSLPRYGHGM